MKLLRSPRKHGGLQRKYGFSNENLGVSNKNMRVSIENMGGTPTRGVSNSSPFSEACTVYSAHRFSLLIKSIINF